MCVCLLEEDINGREAIYLRFGYSLYRRENLQDLVERELLEQRKGVRPKISATCTEFWRRSGVGPCFSVN